MTNIYHDCFCQLPCIWYIFVTYLMIGITWNIVLARNRKALHAF